MYLLDTNVIIDFLNSRLPTKGRDLISEIEPIISVITRIELFASSKISETENVKLLQFIDVVKIIEIIDKDIVNEVIAIRRKRKVKLPDAIIAATAITNNLILLTRNTADFEKIERLSILNPFE